MTLPYYRPTIAKIDLDALTNNMNFFRSRLPKKVRIIAVIKADAYGHGAIPVARHLEEIHVDYFAVAFLDEAIELREAGIRSPILVLGYTPKESIEAAFKYEVTLTVFDEDSISEINEIGKRLNKKLKVHLKVDTGMGRIGIFPQQAFTFINFIEQLEFVNMEGIYTHFATADEKEKDFTLKQYRTFLDVVNNDKRIQSLPLIHLANSAAMIDLPDIEQSSARLGISLYGLPPSDEVSLSEHDLQPVMSLHTKIAYLKTIEPGKTVSYGATFTAQRKTKVATLPIGYADGLPRLLSNKGTVLIKGKRAPIIGRVCMDQVMVDVTDIENVNIGDDVVIIGRDGDHYITMNDIAKIAGTINYEIATQIGKRIPRVYMKAGKVVEITNNLIR